MKLARHEIVDELQNFIAALLPRLKPLTDSWQPSDLLPDLSHEGWRDKIEDVRKKAATLSDDLFVALVGNTVTEEALPSYQTWLNRYDVLRDETGTSSTPWAQWTRTWTAEENRHGDVLNRYLYLSGRVDMRSVEITTQHLLRNGFNTQSEDDFYQAFVYAAFQERATKICHTNVAKLAEQGGDSTLARMCFLIAGDEARHEEAYKRFFGKIIEMDPEGALNAFAAIMRKKISMPARLMSDGTGRDLYTAFAIVVQRTGVYTTQDYADVISHLVEYWKIADIKTFSQNALKDQDYLLGLAPTYDKQAEKMARLIPSIDKEPFPWIFNRLA